jgi:probable phosphoglycerate mutase
MLKAGVTLYFVRHGETEWNRAQRYQGRQDIPLNATGREQAKHNGWRLASALGARLGDLDYVSSPLRRTSESMEILRAAMGLERSSYRTDARLLEVDYGSWEGQLWHEMAKLDAEGHAARLADVWNWRPLGGESYSMVADRVGSWLKDVAGDTVVVAHGGVSRVLRAMLLHLPAGEIMRLEVPQDRILVLNASGARWL